MVNKPGLIVPENYRLSSSGGDSNVPNTCDYLSSRAAFSPGGTFTDPGRLRVSASFVFKEGRTIIKW